MSWEWSHTAEAYQDAEENLRTMSVRKLITIAAEWRAVTIDETGFSEPQFDERKYRHGFKWLHAQVRRGLLTAEILADDIWQRASEQASCSNGGHEAYMCPFECGCHMVSFTLTRETERRLGI